MIIYTNLMPARFGGYTIGPISLIRPKYKDDLSLHAHEAVHRKQFSRNPLIGLAYFFSRRSRKEYEVEAFRAQLAVNPALLEDCARLLSTNYNLSISIAEAKTLLTV